MLFNKNNVNIVLARRLNAIKSIALALLME
jgi:hypothetical protein